MKNPGNSVKRYFSSTHSLLYSYLISLPLLLLYEALIYLSQPDTDQAVRISVDVWIKTLLSYIGRDIMSLTLIVVALIGIVILYRERKRLSSLKLRYFFGMIAEATVYAFVLGLLIASAIGALLQIVQPTTIDQLSITQQLALSLGAGLYEELFFRVLLVSTLLFLFNKLITKKYVAYGSAMIVAALIFSLVHYIGEFGDPFMLGSFLFRFLFGLALNAIYIWRGFGVAAWTHAIYDLIIII